MRITGVDPEHPPESVAGAFKKMTELTGRVVTPALVMAHRPGNSARQRQARPGGRRIAIVEPRLKFMLSVRVAQMIGCPF